jgi:large subunit ribosomal protein L14
MVQIQSVLKCNDNSGILFVKCLHLVNKKKKQKANLGDLIKISILKKKALKFKKQQKIYYGLILGLKKKTRRVNGIFLKQSLNRVVVLNLNFKLLGTRIYGPVCKELKSNINYLKLKTIISLGRGII